MKSRAFDGTLKRAALAAAFFIVAAPAFTEALHDSPGLKAADERVQRLFDQAVKLHRRHAANPKAPAEPLRSILHELSLYHENELATYLSDMGAEGTRSGPIHFAPWALHRLAQQYMQRGSYEEAITYFHDLGERFTGTKVIEPADGVLASVEKAEAAALRGEIQAFLFYAKQEGVKDVADALEDRIEMMHEKFGTEALPGHESRGNYSLLALEALWQALALDKAGYKAWCKDTEKFIKREKDPEVQADIWAALAAGSERLGKKTDALKFSERVAKLLKIGHQGQAPQGAFENLIQP